LYVTKGLNTNTFGGSFLLGVVHNGLDRPVRLGPAAHHRELQENRYKVRQRWECGNMVLLVGILYLKAHESEARGHILPFLSAQRKVGPSFDLSALLKRMYPEAVVDTVYMHERRCSHRRFAAAAASAAGAG